MNACECQTCLLPNRLQLTLALEQLHTTWKGTGATVEHPPAAGLLMQQMGTDNSHQHT
jgi:hypothetical protein